MAAEQKTTKAEVKTELEEESDQVPEKTLVRSYTPWGKNIYCERTLVLGLLKDDPGVVAIANYTNNAEEIRVRATSLGYEVISNVPFLFMVKKNILHTHGSHTVEVDKKGRCHMNIKHYYVVVRLRRATSPPTFELQRLLCVYHSKEQNKIGGRPNPISETDCRAAIGQKVALDVETENVCHLVGSMSLQKVEAKTMFDGFVFMCPDGQSQTLTKEGRYSDTIATWYTSNVDAMEVTDAPKHPHHYDNSYAVGTRTPAVVSFHICATSVQADEPQQADAVVDNLGEEVAGMQIGTSPV